MNSQIMMTLAPMLSAAAMVTPAHAAYVTGNRTTVTRVSTYAKGAVQGDVLIRVANPAVGCEAGYYIANDAVGKKESLSLLLSAHSTNAWVQINAFDSPRWAGSNAAFCEVEGVHLVD